MKKTLLYEHQPHSFYELYVCNDLSRPELQVADTQNKDSHYNKNRTVIRNATPESLDRESKHIIITGTGGIGKSMFLTHLFLSSAQEYSNTDKLPVFVALKDYQNEIAGIVDAIWTSVKAFVHQVSAQDIIDKLESKKVLLMLDGLDELPSSLREKFSRDLDDFVKEYPENNVVMTSRPTNSFVSYSSFFVLNIEPLKKHQAIQLITKLSYWDEQAKFSFLKELDKQLYQSHKEFASNPLLLTVMLMTYTTFGEVPAKMHEFYKLAYDTMARLHDATKGSYKRPFNTKLTPDELSKLFSEFCARTYRKEKIEFTSKEFASVMDIVLDKSNVAKAKGVKSSDFLLDLKDNLCIMYKEGDRYYFIHRSFQEYFTAVYFANGYDENLKKVGDFFEKTVIDTSADKTFDMLYDMISEKVERYIFLPYLDELMQHCEQCGDDAYWEFLERQYHVLFCWRGNNSSKYDEEDNYFPKQLVYKPGSFLYRTILREKKLQSKQNDSGELPFSNQMYDSIDDNFKKSFIKTDDIGINSEAKEFLDHFLKRFMYMAGLEIGYCFNHRGVLQLFYKFKNSNRYLFSVAIKEIRENISDYFEVHQFMESSDFPLMKEYNNVKAYYKRLKFNTEKEQKSDELFDD